ncbi:replicative DNA helicase [Shimwellia blattae]|uniref:DNA 5'-3' helicase n=1 Tax=Shimwellia blattae (strain ATCC 29907 / DSM 4481 / JCM 1650 / NBRC 105725 / CDC 9005-74) TaxID=630626 RepID=I2B9T5_SHIBC|nr:replicative DNA helicase [Shimwellia blattae]AFJ47289.1 replicative DNA helicase [Shimwellia blattae DSM 4481 = NBRC 105725]GAB80518.1 replicative DNA helicase [Shimwellia blattae DSM 4481 = NBRC 105725]VDY64780.1 Replicative DNA helicase [Shimwellia blattae]VEC22879.1 Replicative DNA helicase [Shimwellia blattae]
MSRFIDFYAEQCVLGAIQLSGDDYSDAAVDAIEGLSESDFSVAAHRFILRSLKRLNAAGSGIDLMTLTADIESAGDLEKVGGFAYLAEIAKNTPSVSMLPTYAQKLREFAMGRRMLEILNNGISRLNEPGVGSLEDVIGTIQADVGSVESGSDSGTRQIMDGITLSLDTVEAIMSGEIWKYKTMLGMDDIDRAFGGFNNTDFIVVGGRPGMGKTMFSTTATETIGLKRNKPVLFFSLEMPIEQISERIAFHRARISKEQLLGENGANQDEAWGRISDCLREFQDAPIHINDKTSLSVHQIRAEARRMHKQLGGLGVIVVDYLQKMKMSNPENMNQSVGEIATGLKNLAKELRCPVIALAQLNRAVEQRANKRPVNSDLRESGVIEQEADVIFMVYRDEKYNPNTEHKGITEIICTKSRHAPGAEKTYYFSSRLSGLDPVVFQQNELRNYDYDIEC